MKKLILTLALAATFSSQPALSAGMDVKADATLDATPVVKHYASLV